MKMKGDCQLGKMAGWAGFTDNDIKQIKQTADPGSSKQHTADRQSQAMARKQKLQQQWELAQQRARDFAQGSGSNPLDPAQHLSQPSIRKSPPEQTKPVGDFSNTFAQTIADPKPTVCEETSRDIDENKFDERIKELDEQEIQNMEMNKIEQFRQQQKKIEEENKQKRQLLAEAIKQRSKMAKAEAEKLTQVQKELNHLDSLVSADVSIIRDRIEAASIEFLQAQKRYERAEKEFVEAKIALAEKSELKESLTEHLYTVIQQNEVRKAQRLAVLMKQLGLGGEDCPVSLDVPPLLSFSPINTLQRHPSCPSSPSHSVTSPMPEKSSRANVNNDSPATSNLSEKNPVSHELVSSQNGEDSMENGSSSSQQTEIPPTAGTMEEKGKSVGGGDEKDNEGSVSEQCTKVTENGSPESRDGGADLSKVPI